MQGGVRTEQREKGWCLWKPPKQQLIRKVVINLTHCYCVVTDSLNLKEAHGDDLFTKIRLRLRRNLCREFDLR